MLTSISASLGVPVTYLCAVLGSLAVDLAFAVGEAQAADGHFPARFRKLAYVVGRVVFAVFCAGLLPILLNAKTVTAAFYMGVSAPVIYERLARGTAG